MKIQLSQGLQQSVHQLKRVELSKNVSPYSLNLSQQENSAAVRIFNRSVETRQAYVSASLGNWA